MKVLSRHISACTAVSKHPYEDYHNIVWGYIAFVNSKEIRKATLRVMLVFDEVVAWKGHERLLQCLHTRRTTYCRLSYCLYYLHEIPLFDRSSLYSSVDWSAKWIELIKLTYRYCNKSTIWCERALSAFLPERKRVQFILN